MARRINPNRCIQCNACLPDCPVEGIVVMNAVYVIDPRLCPECAGYYTDPRGLQVIPIRPLETEFGQDGEALAHRNGFHPRRLARE